MDPANDPIGLARATLEAARLDIDTALSQLDQLEPGGPPITVRLLYGEVHRVYWAMGKTWYRHRAGLTPELVMPANYYELMERFHALYPAMASSGIEIADVAHTATDWRVVMIGLDTWIEFQGNVDLDTARAADKIRAALSAHS